MIVGANEIGDAAAAPTLSVMIAEDVSPVASVATVHSPSGVQDHAGLSTDCIVTPAGIGTETTTLASAE